MGDDDEDDPVVGGAVFVLVGTLAVLFSKRSINRIHKERALIERMWSANTTVRSLRELAESGCTLPPVVLLRGVLGARGPLVRALTTQCPTLEAMVGVINQPPNFYDDLAGRISCAQPVGASTISASQRVQEQLKALGVDLAAGENSPLASFDFRRQSLVAEEGEGYLISELLVTRLGCEAIRTTHSDKHGSHVNIERNPRLARFNVHYRRQVSEGLCMTSMSGEIVNLELPPYDITHGDSPSLFLTLPDAFHEFTSFLGAKYPGYFNVLNAHKPFTHLSPFIFMDVSSDTDDGNKLPLEKGVLAKSAKALGLSLSRTPRLGARPVVNLDLSRKKICGALSELGRLSPENWHWNGKGFYDNRPVRANARFEIATRPELINLFACCACCNIR